MLTLWFKYAGEKQVEEALLEGFSTVSIDTWLQVVPQLIARIHSPVPGVARMVQDLLTTVGQEHPQALVYPLSVASKSHASARMSAANWCARLPSLMMMRRPAGLTRGGRSCVCVCV